VPAVQDEVSWLKIHHAEQDDDATDCHHGPYFVPGPHGWVEVDYTKEDNELPYLRLRSGGWWRHPRPQHWYDLKRQALERDHWRCVVCNEKRNLQLHHRYYGRWGWELLQDVTILCSVHHKQFHEAWRAAA
jgi:hypothetical protein